MVVDVGFVGHKPVIHAFDRKGASTVNSSIELKKVMEALTESRGCAVRYKNDLDATLCALTDANSEIDRLKCELNKALNRVAELEVELSASRPEHPKARKRGRRPKDDGGSDE